MNNSRFLKAWALRRTLQDNGRMVLLIKTLAKKGILPKSLTPKPILAQKGIHRSELQKSLGSTSKDQKSHFQEFFL